MCDAIERRVRHIDLDQITLERLMTPIRRGHRVASASLLRSGKLNTNYKILLEGCDEPFVLRLYTNDHTACERDAALHNLMGNKVPLAPLLFHAVNGHGLGLPYAIFRWIDGTMLDEILARRVADDTLEVALAAGQTLAAINQFRFDAPGFFGPTLEYTETSSSVVASFRDYLAAVERRGRAARRFGLREFELVIRFVDEHLGCLGAVEGCYSLVHADYNGSNLIVERDDFGFRVRAVLDWEFAMVGTSIFDVGVFLRHEDKLPRGFRDHFTRAFAEAGGHLPAGWRRASKFLDLINDFAFLDAEGEFPNTFADAISRVQSTLARWGEFED